MAKPSSAEQPESDFARKEAFENFYAQGLKGEGKRDLKVTALAVRKSTKVVRQWAKEDQWDEKLRRRDEKVDAKLDEIAVERVVQLKARYAKAIGNVLDTWFGHHFGSEESAALSVQMMDADQVVKWMKMLLTLLGQPDTIKVLEGHVTHDIDESLKGLSTEELKALVAQKKELPPAPAATVEIVRIEEPTKEPDGEV